MMYTHKHVLIELPDGSEKPTVLWYCSYVDVIVSVHAVCSQHPVCVFCVWWCYVAVLAVCSQHPVCVFCVWSCYVAVFDVSSHRLADEPSFY